MVAPLGLDQVEALNSQLFRARGWAGRVLSTGAAAMVVAAMVSVASGVFFVDTIRCVPEKIAGVHFCGMCYNESIRKDR